MARRSTIRPEEFHASIDRSVRLAAKQDAADQKARMWAEKVARYKAEGRCLGCHREHGACGCAERGDCYGGR